MGLLVTGQYGKATKDFTLETASGNKVFLTSIPVLAIVLTHVSLPYLNNLPATLAEKLPYIPFLIFAGAFMMGVFFKRHRVAMLSALIATAFWVTQNITSAPELHPHADITVALLGILIPLNIAGFALIKDHQLLSLQGLISSAVLLLQFLLGYWLIENFADSFSNGLLFSPAFFDDGVLASLPLSVLIAFIVGLITLVILVCRKGAVFEISFLGSIIAMFFYFYTGEFTPVITIYASLAGLILLWGLIQNSYLIAYIDELTELPGRRALNETLARLSGKYTIAMLDIDHFKTFNDKHGHDVGDQVLRMVASKINNVKGGGKAFRYGGEEFAVVFASKDSKAAFPYLSNIRETIDATRMVLRHKDRPEKRPNPLPPRRMPWQEVHVTISIGVAHSSDELTNTDQVLKAADEALYKSKEKGRNRISQHSTMDYNPALGDPAEE